MPRIILVAAAVIAGYLLFTTVTTALTSHSLAQDEASVRRQIAELDRQHDELVSVREYLSSDEYIESVARSVLGLVKPGETRVIVTSPEADAGTPQTAPTPTDGAWWESLFGE